MHSTISSWSCTYDSHRHQWNAPRRLPRRWFQCAFPLTATVAAAVVSSLSLLAIAPATAADDDDGGVVAPAAAAATDSASNYSNSSNDGNSGGHSLVIIQRDNNSRGGPLYLHDLSSNHLTQLPIPDAPTERGVMDHYIFIAPSTLYAVNCGDWYMIDIMTTLTSLSSSSSAIDMTTRRPTARWLPIVSFPLTQRHLTSIASGDNSILNRVEYTIDDEDPIIVDADYDEYARQLGLPPRPVSHADRAPYLGHVVVC